MQHFFCVYYKCWALWSKLYFNLQIVPLWNLLFSVSRENRKTICFVPRASTGLSETQAYTCTDTNCFVFLLAQKKKAAKLITGDSRIHTPDSAV